MYKDSGKQCVQGIFKLAAFSQLMQSMYNNFMNNPNDISSLISCFLLFHLGFQPFLLVSSDYYLLIAYNMKKLRFLWFNAYY